MNGKEFRWAKVLIVVAAVSLSTGLALFGISTYYSNMAIVAGDVHVHNLASKGNYYLHLGLIGLTIGASSIFALVVMYLRLSKKVA